jgi:hypothetical protein
VLTVQSSGDAILQPELRCWDVPASTGLLPLLLLLLPLLLASRCCCC